MKILKITLIFTALFLCSSLESRAQMQTSQGATQVFTLNDGTTLKGKLVSVSDDVYTIATKHMGTIQVHLSDINNISSGQLPSGNTFLDSAGGFGGQSALGGQVQSMQQAIMADPEMQAALQELMKDPEIMQMFSDPNLMQDMLSMDPATIQNNPGVQQMMQNPKMMEFINRVAQKMGVDGGNPFPK